MTKLLLAPFDPAAPGSHMQRMKLLELVAAYNEAKEDETGSGQYRIACLINEAIAPRLRTDDGTPVRDALAQVSADDYDALVQGLFARAADNVPLASTPA